MDGKDNLSCQVKSREILNSELLCSSIHTFDSRHPPEAHVTTTAAARC